VPHLDETGDRKIAKSVFLRTSAKTIYFAKVFDTRGYKATAVLP
jgi:hypothetical protein